MSETEEPASLVELLAQGDDLPETRVSIRRRPEEKSGAENLSLLQRGIYELEDFIAGKLLPAAKVLTGVMEDPSQDSRARVSAARGVLDFAKRPRPLIEMNFESPLTRTTPHISHLRVPEESEGPTREQAASIAAQKAVGRIKVRAQELDPAPETDFKKTPAPDLPARIIDVLPRVPKPADEKALTVNSRKFVQEQPPKKPW